MRFIFAAMATATLAACGPSTAAPGSLADVKQVTTPAEDTQVLAVLSYASWCGSCKVLDPKIKAVRAANTFEKVEFFALDYSGRDADAFFEDAETLGIADTMRTLFPDKIKTGRLYLFNLQTDEIIGEIGKDMSEAEITTAIEAAARQI